MRLRRARKLAAQGHPHQLSARTPSPTPYESKQCWGDHEGYVEHKATIVLRVTTIDAPGPSATNLPRVPEVCHMQMFKELASCGRIIACVFPSKSRALTLNRIWGRSMGAHVCKIEAHAILCDRTGSQNRGTGSTFNLAGVLARRGEFHDQPHIGDDCDDSSLVMVFCTGYCF